MSEIHDLFEIADNNSNNLIKKAEEIKGIQKDNYIIISELVKDNWFISINMKIYNLNSFLISGKYKNSYEIIKEEKEALKDRYETDFSIEKVLARRLKGYYLRRTIFDNSFKDGKKFKYGALNIGGVGASRYGEACILIVSDFSRKSSLLFVKNDSTQYVIDETRVDIERLTYEIANNNYVHVLAAIKHCICDEKVNQEMLPNIICCEGSYLEAITKDDITPQQIHNIRISKKVKDQYFEYLFKEYTDGINDSEKLWLQEFTRMNCLLKTFGIKLDVVDQNDLSNHCDISI